MGNTGSNLLQATKGNDIEYVEKCVNSKSQLVNKKSLLRSRTSLYIAAKKGHIALARTLLECDEIDVNAADWSGNTPLMQAARKGHTEIVQMLLNHPHIEPNKINKKKQTALWLACSSGHKTIVASILSSHGIDTGGHGQYVPILTATDNNSASIVRLLVELGNILPNVARNNDLETPLHRAARFGSMKVLKYLLTLKHIHVNPVDVHGHTPLQIACMKDDARMVALLLCHNDIDVNHKSAEFKWTYDNEEHVDKGVTPLMIAVAKNSFEMVEMLLRRPSINIDATTEFRRWTALHFAAQRGGTKIACLLVSKGADITMRTRQSRVSGGRLARSVAYMSGHHKTASLLRMFETEDNPSMFKFESKNATKEKPQRPQRSVSMMEAPRQGKLRRKSRLASVKEEKHPQKPTQLSRTYSSNELNVNLTASYMYPPPVTPQRAPPSSLKNKNRNNSATNHTTNQKPNQPKTKPPKRTKRAVSFDLSLQAAHAAQKAASFPTSALKHNPCDMASPLSIQTASPTASTPTTTVEEVVDGDNNKVLHERSDSLIIRPTSFSSPSQNDDQQNNDNSPHKKRRQRNNIRKQPLPQPPKFPDYNKPKLQKALSVQAGHKFPAQPQQQTLLHLRQQQQQASANLPALSKYIQQRKLQAQTTKPTGHKRSKSTL